MPYTPVELRHVKMERTLVRGYKRDEVDRLIEDVTESFEEVWRDRGELADRVEELESQLTDFKQREHLLASTLVSAEKAAAEAKDHAKREAELIVAEAHGEARSITRAAQNERERLFAKEDRSLAVMFGAIRASPRAAAWMAWVSISAPASLRRKPRAPAFSAP